VKVGCSEARDAVADILYARLRYTKRERGSKLLRRARRLAGSCIGTSSGVVFQVSHSARPQPNCLPKRLSPL